MFDDPLDERSRLGAGCNCGQHASQAQHDALHSEEARANRVVERAVLHALFPQDAVRRTFLRAVGAATALAAIETLFPLGAAREAFAQRPAKLEKQKLAVGFIPITCATPIRSSWRTRWASTRSMGSRWMSSRPRAGRWCATRP
jgi:nitrate/nitrite transport system substrate-binding protein